MRRPKDKLIAGIDLHSNNVMIGVINQDGKRVVHRKLDCDLSQVVGFLKPSSRSFSPWPSSQPSTGIGWWMGLRRQGYPIDLANPAKIEQYSGLKHADDKDDAFHLADLQRLNILPKAHVYDPRAAAGARFAAAAHQPGASAHGPAVELQESLYAHDRPEARPERGQEDGAQGSAQALRASGQPTDRPGAGRAHPGLGQEHQPSGESGAGLRAGDPAL